MPQNIAFLGSSISLLSSALSLDCQISLFEFKKLDLGNDLREVVKKTELEKLDIDQNFEVLTYNLLYNQAKSLPNIKFVEQEIVLIEIEKNQTNFDGAEEEIKNENTNETAEIKNIQNLTQNPQTIVQNNQNLEQKSEKTSNPSHNSNQVFEKSFETLKTDNLIIKSLNSGHSKFVWLNYTPKVSQYLVKSWTSFEDLEIDLNKRLEQNKTKKRIDLAVLDRENGDFIGACAIWIDKVDQKENNFDIVESSNKETETQFYKKFTKNLQMEFWLKEITWNQGYGQEMASIVHKWLVKNIEFEKLILTIEKNNTFAKKIATNIDGIINKSKQELNFVKEGKILNFVEYVIENKTKFENKSVNLSQEVNKNLTSGFENNLETEKIKTTKNLFYIVTKNQKIHFDKIITTLEVWQSLENKFGKDLQELNLSLDTEFNWNQNHHLEEDCPKNQDLKLGEKSQTEIEKIRMTEKQSKLKQKLAQNGIFLIESVENQETKNSTKKILQKIQIGLETAKKYDL